MRRSVVFVMGPTASGKTGAAIRLVQHHGFEIVNADAAQVYRDMCIGTARPNAQELAQAPHRLIDFVDPAEAYSAAQFRHDALVQIEDIHNNGNVPVLVGGSMFYFHALEQGLSLLPGANQPVRRRIEARAKQLGWPALYRQLAGIDPELAGKINPNDPQRIQRALEIHEITGKTPSRVFGRDHSGPMPYPAIKLVIAPYTRETLHQRIARRFEHMLHAGLIGEVERLKSRPDLTLDTPAMRTVGYRQVWQYLQGDFDRQEMIDRAVAATRQLAKRQLTWLRNQSGIVWFSGTGKLDFTSVEAYMGLQCGEKQFATFDKFGDTWDSGQKARGVS